MPARAKAPSTRRPTEKKPFNIGVVLGRIRKAVQPFADAGMFALRDLGFGTAFQQLVGCIISIRARDEVSVPAAQRLLERAPDPETMSRMSAREIDELIHPATFHESKAKQIRDMAVRVTEEFEGDLPCDFDVMTSFSGVGPKCANLALGVACNEPSISVDIHVHRVTNRWGYVATRTPEQTRIALELIGRQSAQIDLHGHRDRFSIVVAGRKGGAASQVQHVSGAGVLRAGGSDAAPVGAAIVSLPSES